MQVRLTAMRTALLIFLVAGLADASASGNNAMAKVIEMLQGLMAKSSADMQKEEVGFSKFNQWCSDTLDDRQAQIEQGNAEKEELEATIDQAKADINTLQAEIEDLTTKLSTWESEMEKEKATRAESLKAFQAEEKDLSESVSALERAIRFLKKNKRDLKQAGSEAMMFFQKDDSFRMQRIVGAVDAYLQEPGLGSINKNEAYGYEDHSGGIVAMLSKLLDEFVKERRDAQKGEMNSVQSYELVMQNLKGETDNANAVKTRQEGLLASTQSKLGQAEKDLVSTNQAIADDQDYRAKTEELCKAKADEYPQRRELRENELKALTDATQILTKQFSLLQQGKPILGQSLMQMKTELHRPMLALGQVVTYLLNQSHSLKSDDLSLLADRVSEGGTFDKVTKMIYDMINKLKNQLAEEVKHQGWCNKEMSVNKQVRADKTSEVAKKTAQRDELNASIQKLTQQIADLDKKMADTEAAMQTATDQRREDNQNNQIQIRDAKDAQFAINQAMAVLKEFYNKAGGATALLSTEEQQDDDPSADAPATWDSVNTGFQDSSGGVLAFLDTINKDYAALQAEIEASEAQQATDFDKFMTESKRDQAVSATNKKNAQRQKAEDENNLNETVEDLKAAEGELAAAQRYHQKLIPSCVHKPKSFEEKQADRAKEIESLKEALSILGSASDTNEDAGQEYSA